MAPVGAFLKSYIDMVELPRGIMNMAVSLLKKLKKPIRALVVASLAILFACSPLGQDLRDTSPPVHHLVVLYTNDTHGHPLKFNDASGPDVGGLPARATLVSRIRQEDRNVLLLDAGDLNTGMAESNFFKAKPDILGYNYIGYDAMVVGNHEFDNSIDVLKAQMKMACFPFLSANVKTKGGKYLATPFIIKEFNGFRVAVFGLTTKETEITGNPKHVKDLLFEDEIETALRLVPALRKEADVVIALVHMGIYDGFERGSKLLASQVSGIDLIVDGNTDTKLESPIIIRQPRSDRETLIVQAWHWGLVVGRIDLWIHDEKVVDFAMKLIPINLKRVVKRPDGTKAYELVGQEIEEDKRLLEQLQPFSDKVEAFLSGNVGYAEATFSNVEVRLKETALGDMVSDSIQWSLRRFDPDFAIVNGGAIRSALPKGEIKMKTIYDILPFDSTVVMLSMKGRDVQALFDYISTIPPGDGAFPQVSEGVGFTLNRTAQRCEDILIDGKPINPEGNYNIVTNSYLADGGDGYGAFLRAFDSFDSSMFQRNVLIEYIRHLGGIIRPDVKGRIKIIHPEK